MKTKLRTITTLLALVFGIGAILVSSVTKANSPVIADHDDTVVRWDVINVQGPGLCFLPGGNASATTPHSDNSTITLTGSGTFEPDDHNEVTGGGTWTTASGSGTYRVTELVSWHMSPGALPCNNDTIPGERAAGLAVFRIRYNERSTGVLAVSCRLIGTPTPPLVFEGIAVSKDFVDYSHNVEPVPGVNANRTIFHIQKQDDDDDN